jgi:hypothetical protein
MAIFNSYVKLPEGKHLFIGTTGTTCSEGEDIDPLWELALEEEFLNLDEVGLMNANDPCDPCDPG